MTHSEVKPDSMVYVHEMSAAEGDPGKYVGTVDHMDGDHWIKLKKDDSPTGEHQWIPMNWVKYTDEEGVYLSCSFDEFSEKVYNSRPEDMEESEVA